MAKQQKWYKRITKKFNTVMTVYVSQTDDRQRELW